MVVAKSNGWDAQMCRYKFGEGKCSHPSNVALECVGEDKCKLSKEPLNDDGSYNAERLEEPEEESGDSDQEMCPNTKTGIYCKKYGHFHCAGKENCETREDYIEHLKEHKEEIQDMDIDVYIKEQMRKND
ncbi:MAG: hypothetical protein V5A88_01565 [Candidatus Thermoplasmatota archaeon]